MLKILFLSLGIFSWVGFVVLVQANTQITENSEFILEPLLLAQTTQGPEESEFAYAEEEEPQRFGIQLSVGQTLLTGEEASSEKGFNNALGGGLGMIFRYTQQLNLSLEYWASKHEGIQNDGVLQKSHVAATLDYALQRGFFSPFGIIGAGLYFSSFSPGQMQKQAGLVSSTADTFGIVLGLGGRLDLANNFDVSLRAVRHHSFKYKNSKNQTEELLPFTIIGLMGTFYF